MSLKTSETLRVAIVSAAALALLAPTSVMAAWVCSAKNMQSFSYSGGGTAYIHLRPYGSGNSYPVRKVSATKVAGKTSNGTSFTCTKKG